MNVFLLYLLLLKATLTSFSGLASLPMVRDDFVVERHLLTDRQLNTAVVAGRTGPGPNGLYIVSVGYFVAGLPGAASGLLAVMTPAFLVLPLMRWVGARAGTARIRSAIRAVVLASAGLLLSASLPLAHDAITGRVPLMIVLISFVVLSFTRVDSAWVMLSSAAAGLMMKLAG
ncbi:MAG: chromate transporter [Acidobacteria bacterium]|jgi:chromate transporter|nr:MAG: chromate transporter [Acidobacteriota bacterium]